MELFNRVLTDLKERKAKIEAGGINCIPLGFPRFEAEWPGVEQKTYIQVTANTKVGKTQISDYLFLYNTVLYAYTHPDQLRIKVFYFSLEMSKEEKELQLMSHLLWKLSKGKIRKTPKDLRSTSASDPLNQEIIDILESEEYQNYFKFFEEHVEFIDSIRNPFGIYKFMRDYAKANGVQHKKTINIVDKVTGEVTPTEVDDYYEANDPDEYVFCIVDHMALISPEKGGNLREAMAKLSSEYLVPLRNKYRYIIVAIVQQAAAQESNDNMKLNKLRPTLDGYGDCKIISRDANIIIGLFAPSRYGITRYEGYNIDHFKDNIRFMEIIAGREGGGGSLCPLLFDGGTNYFHELPLPTDQNGLHQVDAILSKIRGSNFVYFLINKKKNLFKKLINYIFA